MLLAWGPGYTEEKLLTELRRLRPHGTSVLVYNLWENEHGDKELDLFSDLSDVRTRPATEVDGVAGGGGEEAGVPVRRTAVLRLAARTSSGRRLAKKYFGYQHSLRQYAAILYRQHPVGFTMSCAAAWSSLASLQRT